MRISLLRLFALTALLLAPLAALHVARLRKMGIEWWALGSGALEGRNLSGENK